MPTLEPSTSVIILSDLHLSTGPDQASGSPNPLEQFYADQAFSHFVECLIEGSRRDNHPGRLLFLGDFLDFLHAGVESRRSKNALDIDMSEATTHKKLERIFAGHPVFFQALVNLVVAGFHVDLVPGNHDIDLMRPTIQSHFTELLAKGSSQATIAAQVHFFPWLYTIPGLLYAEHGNQYHDLNSFPALLSPYRPGHPDQIELPLGSYLDTLFYHLIASVGIPDHEINSPIRYLAGKFPGHPTSLVKALPVAFRFAWIALQIMAYRSSLACAVRRKAYQTGVLAEYATGLALDLKTVVKLDRLSAAPSARMLLRLLRLAIRAGRQPKGGYLFQAARSIHQVLQSEGRQVPFYVFGHSHQAIRLPLSSHASPTAYFLNTGTWSVAPFSSAERTRNTFPFVQIVNVPNVQDSTARLLQWNEDLKQVEPFS